MTRTEFDAAFKLALGYVISEDVFRLYNDSFMYCIFKENDIICNIENRKKSITNGIICNIENRKKSITYNELINFIPHIQKQIINDGEAGRWLVNICDDFHIVLQR